MKVARRWIAAFVRRSFLWYIYYYSVQSLYAPFPFTKKYIASPTREGISYSQTFPKSLIKN